jgi:NAD(P)-dependent dehydrogenase (short-subunit alcohol dehydrogenase family)
VIEVNFLALSTAPSRPLSGWSRRSGVILNISSVHEMIPCPGYSAYTASKAGLSMMTHTPAREVAPYGVRVPAIGPGAIKTSINRSVWSDPASLKDLLEKIPLNRLVIDS